jgi:DNA repair exonuclease SbcCD ATPase subunit
MTKLRHFFTSTPARVSGLFVVAALATWSCTNSSVGDDAVSARAPDSTSIEDVQREAGELAETVADYGEDQRDAVAREFESAISEVDGRLQAFESEVEENWESLSEQARREAQQDLAMLQTRRAELAEAYDALKSDSGAAWEEIKNGFTEAYADISSAIDEAEKEFDKG